MKTATFIQSADNNHQIKLRFPYDLDTIDKVSNLPRRIFWPGDKYWTTPLSLETIELLLQWEFTCDTHLLKFVDLEKERIAKMDFFSIPGLIGKPFPYQNKGVAFLDRKNGRALLADEMGLGKTVQAIGWMQLHPDKTPVVVVCPASIKINWKKEIKKWTGREDVQILSGTTPSQLFGNIIIINYDILAYWVDELKAYNPQVLITDECFPPGTKIQTPKGNINIEDLNVGDAVFNATGVGYVEHISKKETVELVRLHLSNGKTIDTTPNHPFFTTDGWVNALGLFNKQLFENRDIINIFAKAINTRKNESAKVRRMRKGTDTKRFSKEQVLWNILLCEVEKSPSPCKGSIKINREKKEIQDCYDKSSQKKSKLGKRTIKKNVISQSFNSSGSNGKNKKSLETLWTSFKQTTIKRRERKTFPKSTTNSLGSLGSGLENRICNTYKTIKNFWISFMLQSRYWASKIQSVDRIRWMDASIRRYKTIRFKENYLTNNIRVVRVEILQPGSDRKSSDCLVYNLQVSNHPSYYAEGFLVHNCHYFKANSAARTKAVKQLAKGIPHVIAISGTPILNKPIEIYNAVKIVDPELFPNYTRFAKRYCNARYNGFGWDLNGASHTPELHEILTRTIMIRRLKKDVLPDLPDKLYSFIPMELNNSREYREAEMDYISYVLKTKGEVVSAAQGMAIAMVRYEALKQLAVKGKMTQAISWINDFLESGQKLVLFAWHTEIIDLLKSNFSDIAVTFDGRTSPKEKDNAISLFQNDEKKKLFIGNIKAAGVGITLTAASNVAFLELPWTPGDLDQAIDRCHRIGQKECVNVHYLLAAETIEERIARLLDSKRKVLSALLDGKEVSQETLIEALMKEYNQLAFNYEQETRK